MNRNDLIKLLLDKGTADSKIALIINTNEGRLVVTDIIRIYNSDDLCIEANETSMYEEINMENKYPEWIMKNVRQVNGLKKNDTSMDKEIMKYSPTEVLEEYLNWEGIYGYGSTIMDIISEIFVEVN